MIRHLSFILMLVCIWSQCGISIYQGNRVDKLEDHIEYLEEYIQENGLPTPAWRIDE